MCAGLSLRLSTLKRFAQDLLVLLPSACVGALVGTLFKEIAVGVFCGGAAGLVILLIRTRLWKNPPAKSPSDRPNRL